MPKDLIVESFFRLNIIKVHFYKMHCLRKSVLEPHFFFSEYPLDDWPKEKGKRIYRIKNGLIIKSIIQPLTTLQNSRIPE